MLNKFYDDLNYLPKSKFNAKYTVAILTLFLSCLLVGQLITSLIPLSQLNKVSGKIINMRTVVDSWSHNRFSNRSLPNYALSITLNNMQSYNIEEDSARTDLGSSLKKGQLITIYYPTKTLRIISAGLARDVSQVERGGKVLYSWKDQQKGERVVASLLMVTITVLYWLVKYLGSLADVRKML